LTRQWDAEPSWLHCSSQGHRTRSPGVAEGHRIIAAIAADELTPATRSHVAALVGTDNVGAGMMEVSTWADEIGPKRPEIAPWHFVDIPVEALTYDARRDCLNDVGDVRGAINAQPR
jgi:hypothetical protein